MSPTSQKLFLNALFITLSAFALDNTFLTASIIAYDRAIATVSTLLHIPGILYFGS
jgi:hypothetical protein